jgi:pimeloyl-ACP methyl ester carboxylesterase
MTRTITLQREDGPLVADIYEPSAESDRLPVLLVHGWGGSGRYWHSLIERLESRFALIVPDLPGVGRSLPVQRPHDIFDHVATLEALLADQQITRVQIVGHSMGAAIALVLAAKRPELVERLVLTAMSLFRSETERAIFSMVTEVAGVFMHFRAPWMADLPLLTHQSASRYFYQVPDDEALLRAGFLDYLQMDHATALASARSAASMAIPAAARQVQAPTLLIAARQDQVMPVANVNYTVEVLHCQLRWIEQSGHLPMVERPDEYAAVVREFLEGAPAGA